MLELPRKKVILIRVKRNVGAIKEGQLTPFDNSPEIIHFRL